MLNRLQAFFLDRYRDAPPELQKRAKYLLVMNSITIAFLLAAGVVRLATDPRTGLAILSFMAVEILVTLLIRIGRSNMAGIISILLIFVLASFLVFVAPLDNPYELYRTSIYLVTGIFISALITYRRKNFLLYGATSILFLTALFVIRAVTRPELAATSTYTGTYVILVFLNLGATAIAYNILSMTRELKTVSENEARLNRKLVRQMRQHSVKLERTVEQKTAELSLAVRELSRRNETITGEMMMAQRVQRNIIPKEDSFPRTPSLRFGAAYQAMTNVGGDLYDIIDLGEGRYSFLMVDVSGHGMPAAMITSMLKVSFAANSRDGLSTNEICDRVDREIYALIGDLEYYATAYYCILDTATGGLEFTNCGHHAAVLYRNASRTVEMLDTTGSVLGSFRNNAGHGRERVTLDEGDRLLLYTDGVIETRNPEDEFYDHDRLFAWIRGKSGLAPADFVGGLVTEIEAFAAGRPAADDKAVLYVEFVKRAAQA